MNGIRDVLGRKHASEGFLSKIKRRSFSGLTTGGTAQEDLGLPVPHLPNELWRRIIAYTIGLTGSNAVDLDDAFGPPHHNEEFPEVDRKIFQDRKSLRLVCRGWNTVVDEVSAQYLTIYSQPHLTLWIRKFEKSKKKTIVGLCLGELTHRIDFAVIGKYNPALVVKLLALTPNVAVYVNKFKNEALSTAPRCTPSEIIDALAVNLAKSLRRLEWMGPDEFPSYIGLSNLCTKLDHLETLRLTGIHNYETFKFTPLILPHLKTLSLGLIPHRAPLEPTWEPLLLLLTVQPNQLPALTRFEVEIFPLYRFFVVHGHKLRVLRTTTWSAEYSLIEALALCPNLEDLILTHLSEQLHFPTFHPSLQRVCILPAVENIVDVPHKVFANAVLAPLDLLLYELQDRMITPCLREVRVRNTGAYADIVEHSLWLDGWWRRWNVRGVEFTDSIGVSYQKQQICKFSPPPFSF